MLAGLGDAVEERVERRLDLAHQGTDEEIVVLAFQRQLYMCMNHESNLTSCRKFSIATEQSSRNRWIHKRGWR